MGRVGGSEGASDEKFKTDLTIRRTVVAAGPGVRFAGMLDRSICQNDISRTVSTLGDDDRTLLLNVTV